MLLQTKKYKSEYEKDIKNIYQHNNSKINARTENQNQQACRDKINYYMNKWKRYLLNANSKAQEEYCYSIISKLEKLPKYYI